ncbi:MAG: ribosome small subunit-dependent GTPase A [Candidatus Gastranaerophilales bacterium]|nr:ribosome small subunit-dependent GTPase A [Candidatus Gastranaerophilales bacterium]
MHYRILSNKLKEQHSIMDKVCRGQVYKIHSDFYYVNFENRIYECKIREVLKKQDKKIYAGDFVHFENGYITSIEKRKNFIPRPAVANVNQVVIVSAVKEPELDFYQLNRYVAFAEYYNLDIKLCFNKNDLSQDDKLIEKVFSIYEPLGYDIVFTSALEGLELDEFEEILSGRISVLCGQSGVGKSSLINALNPNFKLRTNNISKKTLHGTHTTRHCEIINVSDNIRIIDTPGFSNLKFDFLMPQDVSKLFREFKPYMNGCKYKSCLHTHEDGCKIIDNIDKIASERYESYLEFVKEAKGYKEKIKYQGNKVESRHKQIFNKTAVKISANKRQRSRKVQKQDLYRELEDE